MYSNSYNDVDENELEFMVLELIFSFVALIALILTLIISVERINAYKQGKLNNQTISELGRKSEIPLLLIILSTLFFAYTNYRNYKNNPSSANKNFLIAAILVLIAAIMRYVTLYQSRGEDFSGVQDVI